MQKQPDADQKTGISERRAPEAEQRRKQAEEARRESEANFRNMVEQLVDVLFATDSNGFITVVSPSVLQMFGWKPEEMVGRNFIDLLQKSEIPDAVAQFKNDLVSGRKTQSLSFVMKRKDRSTFPGELSKSLIWKDGRTAGTLCMIRDITKRKRAEEALRKAEKNFRCSLDESPLGVRIVTIDGETIYANRAILKILGCETFEELKTTPLKKCYTPESYAEFRIRREKRRQGDDVPSEYTVYIIRENEEVRHLQVFRKEILWDGERQFQVIYQDITERRRAEEALAAKSVQLEETNTALRILLQCVKEEQQKIERRIMANIRKLVMPNLEQLRDLRLNDLQKNCLDIVTVNLQQVTSPFLQNLGTCFADFTPREIQVANMIRQGKTSKKIADIFHTSIRNIDFHRDNIRKKLGLSHQKSNLRTFLMKLSEE